MASAHQFVRLPGILRGPEREATCIVRAIRVTQGDVSTLARKHVVSVSQNLPDGIYQLSVDGGPPERVRYSGGHFLDGQFG